MISPSGGETGCIEPCRPPDRFFNTGDSGTNLRRVALLSIHSSPLAAIGSGDAGGMNLFVRRLADELASRGIGVDVFTRRADRHSPDIVTSQTGARFIQLRGGPARDIPKGVLPLHIPAIVQSLRDFVETDEVDYDVVNAHYWISGMVGVRTRAFHDAPVISMFHTLSKVKEAYAGRESESDSALRFHGERSVIDGSDVIVGATAGELDVIERYYQRSPSRFAVIAPGVDMFQFSPRDRAETRSALGLGDGPIILFVGRFDPMKGLDRLLDSLAMIRADLPAGTKAVIAGGSPRDIARYMALARHRGLADMLDFRGVVPPESLPAYYSAADITAVPSVYESFGMAAVESMACGTPVVAFGVGGLAETVRDGHTGWLAPPGDVPAYAAALRRALLDEDLNTMGRRARLSVHRFSWHCTVGHTLDLFAAAAAEHQEVGRMVAGA